MGSAWTATSSTLIVCAPNQPRHEQRTAADVRRRVGVDSQSVHALPTLPRRRGRRRGIQRQIHVRAIRATRRLLRDTAGPYPSELPQLLSSSHEMAVLWAEAGAGRVINKPGAHSAPGTATKEEEHEHAKKSSGHGSHRRGRGSRRQRGCGRRWPDQALPSATAGEGAHKDQNHFIDLGLVAEVEDQKVRLSANAADAVTSKRSNGRPRLNSAHGVGAHIGDTMRAAALATNRGHEWSVQPAQLERRWPLPRNWSSCGQ